MISVWIVNLDVRKIPDNHFKLIAVMGAFSTEKKARQVARTYNSRSGSLEFYGEVKELQLDEERKQENLRKEPSDCSDEVNLGS